MSVFVWNISDHDSCATVSFNFININDKCFWLLQTDSSFIPNWRIFDIIVITVWHLDHHGHIWGWVAGIQSGCHVCCLRAVSRLIPCWHWIGTMLSVLCNNSHAWVYNGANHLVLVLALRRLSPFFWFVVLLDFVFILVLVL